MPTVMTIQDFGWRDYIYSNDHEPPHMHIYLNEELLFEIAISGDYEILRLHTRKHVKAHKIDYLQQILKQHSEMLMKMWEDRRKGLSKYAVIEA